MNLSFKCLIVIFCFCVVLPIRAENKSVPIYLLSINIDRNKKVQSEEKRTSNTIIFINDNPVTIYSNGSVMLQINQWLKPGKNSISLKGDTAFSLLLNLIETQGKEQKTILLKEEKSADNKNIKVWFDSKVTKKLPIFQANNKIPTETKNLIPFLKNYFELLNKEKYTEFVNVQLEGILIWQPMAYNAPLDPNKIKQGLVKQYKTNKLKIPDLDWKSIHIIKGKSTVLIYQKMSKYNSPMLCTAKMGEREITIPALQLAYISNHWIIWK